MIKKVDYEKAISKKRRENVKEVVRNIYSEQMQQKIINYAIRHNLNKNYVEQMIIDSPNFARNFAKDPLKQSIHEKVAGEYIKSLDVVDSFKSLPASGKNAKYVGPTGVSIGKNFGKAKSIDFEIRVGDKIVYATHKHTGSEGGAQDNQFNDVKQFILEVVHIKQSDLSDDYFVAILDGPYYQRYNRLEELKTLSVGCLEILTINELYIFLQNIKE